MEQLKFESFITETVKQPFLQEGLLLYNFAQPHQPLAYIVEILETAVQ
jgi:hypothetical protein